MCYRNKCDIDIEVIILSKTLFYWGVNAGGPSFKVLQTSVLSLFSPHL